MVDVTKQIQEKVGRFISDNQLLQHDRKYLVALSGGADSVAMLLILSDLRYSVEAIHCNFNLRGEESVRDENFCMRLCNAKNIPFHRVHFNTRDYAELHGQSIEMAARELRYRYFEQLRKDIGAADICVAHHQDDNVETILMNLVRGTGMKGLTGIRPRNGHVVRPMLCLSRSEILKYLDSIDDVWSGQRGQTYVTDSSNLVPDVVRNKIRLHVIPLLQEINPSFSQGILEMAVRLADAECVVDESLTHALEKAMLRKDVYSLDVIAQQPSPELVLFRLLSVHHFTSSQILDVAHHVGTSSTGTYWESPTHIVSVDRENLVVFSKDDEMVKTEGKRMRVPETGLYVYSPSQRFRFSVKPYKKPDDVSCSPFVASLDADLICWPLCIRHIEEGDRFVPFGMKGSKLVSDYLTDKKRNLYEKRSQLVITDASGKIVWLVRERTDNRFRVSETTRNILYISME